MGRPARGRDLGDPLFLQVKQAEPSVLEPYTEPSVFASDGERVVAGQSLMQAASDIFLGWNVVTGPDGHAPLLPQTALGLEGIGQRRGDESVGARRLRSDLRVDARTVARSNGRSRGDRGVRRQERHIGPGAFGVRCCVCRPERAGSRCARRRDRHGTASRRRLESDCSVLRRPGARGCRGGVSSRLLGRRRSPAGGQDWWQCLALRPLPHGHGSFRPAAAKTCMISSAYRPARTRSAIRRIGPSMWSKNAR